MDSKTRVQWCLLILKQVSCFPHTLYQNFIVVNPDDVCRRRARMSTSWWGRTSLRTAKYWGFPSLWPWSSFSRASHTSLWSITCRGKECSNVFYSLLTYFNPSVHWACICYMYFVEYGTTLFLNWLLEREIFHKTIICIS